MSAVQEYAGVVDRTSWPSGPWDDELDKRVWVDPTSGLDCMIRRGGGGAWCGYVGVPPSHPWHGKGYASCPSGVHGEDWGYCDCSPGVRVEVHGGLTYAADCDDEGDEATAICHVPQPGRPADVWWFGFDCNHAGDGAPEYLGRSYFIDERYRDQSYVTAQVESLALQLAEVAS